MRLVEAWRVALDGFRFGFSTRTPDSQFKVASYPTLRSAVVQNFGVGALNAASPNGKNVVFHERVGCQSIFSGRGLRACDVAHSTPGPGPFAGNSCLRP